MEITVRALEIFLWTSACILLIPCAVYFVECLAAPRPAHTAPPQVTRDVRTIVLIPAHDEASGIAETIESVLAASVAPEQILVVADNCADATAAIARAYETNVIERADAAHVGKGYALAYGIECLKAAPPEIVIVLDADCTVAPDALTRLTARALETGRPAQGAYTMRHVADAAPKTLWSNFAFFIKNVVRPSGLHRLHAPCLLTGSGMAFPWNVLPAVAFASDSLSEDLWLSVQLTCAGHAPLFCGEALICSKAALGESAMKQQRTRWEQGHWHTIVNGIPRLVRVAIAERRTDPLWLALELGIPPFVLLTVCVLLVFVVSALGLALGFAQTPFFVAALNPVLLGMAILLAWWKFGRAMLPARLLRSAPAYVFWKLSLWFPIFFKRQRWTRTERDTPARGEQ